MHYVLTMEHTITQGHHLYFSSCLQSSASEIVHSFVCRYVVTNELHYTTVSMLRRLLCTSVNYFVSGRYASGKLSSTASIAHDLSHQSLSGLEMPDHVINIMKVEGLFDMIALGNIIEFGTVLDHRTYDQQAIVSDDVYLEREAAMSHYRTLIHWFADRYGVLMNNTWLDASYIFKHCLINFAATLCDYFTKQHPTIQRESRLDGITPAKVRRTVCNHLQVSWPDLVPAFYNLSKSPSPFLYYTGPAFRIIRKTPFRLEQENLLHRMQELDYEASPIYVALETSQDLQVEHPAEKRTHAVSPPLSPSDRRVMKRRKGVN